MTLKYLHTGPDHLIIRDPKAIPVVLGPKNMWPKHSREFCNPFHYRAVFQLPDRLCGG
jgi:hypothetical protein